METVTRAQDDRTNGATFAPGWYVVAESGEIPRGRPVGLERFGTTLALFRKPDGALVALDDRCRHRGASLSLGTVQDACVVCPFHGFAFDGSGACVRAPVLGPDVRPPRALATRAHEVREQDGWVWLWWGPAPESLPEVPRFAHLHAGKHRWHTIAREWPASYVRVIENQLDPFHLPFVHRSTIGRGMDPAITVHHRRADDALLVWAGPEREDPRAGFYLEFLWANLWENHIGPKLSIVAAFAPIDATRTRTYLRTYQGFVTLPVLGWIVDRLMAPSNHVIFAQDERVVVSQPQTPLLPEGEILVKADGAIIAFRAMLRERSGVAAG
jgi:phenylpropionate dioxygenase-like ring-hydroxylating dioxygenase large terminal subunit